MQSHLLLSISSEDKPGVIEAVSTQVEQCGGSWLESRLAHLSGRFVGVVRVRVDNTKKEELESRLFKLEHDGININIDAPIEAAVQKPYSQVAFSASGPDRIGIVKEISSAFVSKGINVEELETTMSSMPYSGAPIFEAKGLISIPDDAAQKQLENTFDIIANDLGLDLQLDSNA